MTILKLLNVFTPFTVASGAAPVGPAPIYNVSLGSLPISVVSAMASIRDAKLSTGTVVNVQFTIN